MTYLFTLISLNLLQILEIAELRPEFLFITPPLIPTMIFCPVCVFTLIIVYVRRKSVRVCYNCNLHNEKLEQGLSMAFLNRESAFQLKNLICMFSFITALIWLYYLYGFDHTNINNRDKYVFVWTFIIIISLDIIYFTFRYTNLYQELNNSDIIITPTELNLLPVTTYIRYYVICNNSIYLKCDNIEKSGKERQFNKIASPFLISEKSTQISEEKILRNIRSLTGINNGQLKFFFGRVLPGISKIKIYRYFYFLDGEPDEYKTLKIEGKWIDFNKLKYIYATTPDRFSKITIRDITRLVTIFMTEKTFKENGNRRSKLKTYHPDFDISEVRHSQINLNDDKWIHIAEFNSDKPFYTLRKYWRKIMGTDQHDFTNKQLNS